MAEFWTENIGFWQHGIAGLLSWISCGVTQLERLFTQLGEPVGVLETVLEACPLLERGLGNILASATATWGGEPVPALLRDILAARQLEHVLGTPAVTFLQVPVPIFFLQKMHHFRGYPYWYLIEDNDLGVEVGVVELAASYPLGSNSSRVTISLCVPRWESQT
jgi:hypothetical protein